MHRGHNCVILSKNFEKKFSPSAMFSIVFGSSIIPCLTLLSPLSETDLSLEGFSPKMTGVSMSGETDFA